MRGPLVQCTSQSHAESELRFLLDLLGKIFPEISCSHYSREARDWLEQYDMIDKPIIHTPGQVTDLGANVRDLL